jgi:hypothetical protein
MRKFNDAFRVVLLTVKKELLIGAKNAANVLKS